MDFRQLQYINAVAEFQSITKAAASLYISQPSLSHFISKTEEELGVKLFDRSTSPISLTFAGERYIEDAKQILKIHEQMRKQFRDISRNMTGRLRVGMPRERAAYMLPLILPEYQESYPGIEVQLYTAGGKELFDALQKGRIDFMILPHNATEKGLRTFHIYEEELLLVAGKGLVKPHHLLDSHTGVVNLGKIADLPLITLQKGHAIRTAIDLLLQEYKVSPPLFMETHSNITCLRLASASLGVAIAPRMTIELARAPAEYEVYSLGIPPVTWEVIALTREDAYVGVAEKAFLDTARHVFSQAPRLSL